MSKDVEQQPEPVESASSASDVAADSPQTQTGGSKPSMPRDPELQVDGDVEPFADTVPAMPVIQRFDRSAQKKHSPPSPDAVTVSEGRDADEPTDVGVEPLAGLINARDTVVDERLDEETDFLPLNNDTTKPPPSFIRNEAESTRELPVLRSEELWFIHDTPPPPLKVGVELVIEGIRVSILSTLAVQTFERRYRVSAEGFDHPLLLKQGSTTAPFVRYKMEAEALRTAHEDGDVPELPKVYGQEDAEGCQYIITDLPSGRPYISLLETGQLSLADHLRILESVCTAVKRLHYCGFILTSLRPTSFEVNTSKLSVHLGDFLNICETVGRPPYALASPFTAPEITEMGPADEGADIFSLGALLYRAVTGNEVPPEKLGRVFVPRDPAALSPMVFQLLSRSLSPPSDRFFDVAEFTKALGQLERELTPRLHIDLAMRSSTGMNPLRIVNQDSGGYLEILRSHRSIQSRLGFYCVADGMGGHEDGDRASELATHGSLQCFQRLALEMSPDEWRKAHANVCKRIASAGSRHLVETVRTEGGGRRMGTTFTSILLVDNHLALAHLGDSRAILYRDGEVVMLSEDHSLVGMMVKAGQMTEEQAEKSDEKNILMRSIGADHVVRAELFDGLENTRGEETLEMLDGDRLILVSDGVWGMIPKVDMGPIFAAANTTVDLAVELCSEALRRGGSDNVVVLALDFKDDKPIRL